MNEVSFRMAEKSKQKQHSFIFQPFFAVSQRIFGNFELFLND